MSTQTAFREHASLDAEPGVAKQIAFNMKRAFADDQSKEIDALTAKFDYARCRNDYWNPEEFSFLYGTALWEEASQAQRLVLNHLYWVAYYSQIISAEVATIFFNQVAAAGLYGAGSDFRTLCNTLDLESRQERIHVNAFKSVGEAVERELFGRRMFTYAMRGPYAETMVFTAAGKLSQVWRTLQIRAFCMVAPERPTLAAHYLMIRGLRTLNGKMIQERLAKHVETYQAEELAPVPARISKAHFTDETFHFNTSRIVSHEVPKALPKPSRFEVWAINRAVAGCQIDHSPASAAINGIFWHDPALFEVCYRLFRSDLFGMDDGAARHMLQRCFGEESEGFVHSLASHRTAVDNYRAYVAKATYLTNANKAMSQMACTDLAARLAVNRRALKRFRPQLQ